MEVYVAQVDELADGDRICVEYDGKEVGVFRVHGRFYAWRNRCAHQGGPVCQGRIFPRVLEPIFSDGTVHGLRYSDDELHIVCPWHGYEYDLTTGQNAGDPRLRLQPVPVIVRDRDVYVEF